VLDIAAFTVFRQATNSFVYSTLDMNLKALQIKFHGLDPGLRYLNGFSDSETKYKFWSFHSGYCLNCGLLGCTPCNLAGGY
jgi:hypothetical protein